MGRQPVLSGEQKRQIIAYNKETLSSREIARRIHRSFIVSNYLRLGTNYGTKSSGRPRKLTPRQERRVIKQLSAGGTSLGRLAQDPNIRVHKSSLSGMVARKNFMLYKKKKRQPRLTDMHKKRLISWAKEHVTWKAQWKQVVFSDENKFNLDGPDGAAYYWHDLRIEEQMFSKWQQGGGSLMTWAGFGYCGKTDLAFQSGRMKSTDYQDLLDVHLFPFGEAIGSPCWIIQQDNASIHTANSTWEWFLQNGVHVMDWPANLPDLNPMEKLWSILCHSVYADSKQYSNITELKAVLMSAWENTEVSTFQKLIDSMRDRVFKVVFKQGSYTGY